MVSLKDKKGTETVEFAIVSFLLFLLLFGIIEFSILLYNKAVITNASREGARAGIVARYDNTQTPATWAPLSDSDITDIVNQYCSDHLISFGTSATATTKIEPEYAMRSDEDNENQKNPLTVTVEYPYSFLVPKLFGAPPILTLTAVTVMRME